MKVQTRNRLALAVLAVGSLQFVGDLTGSRLLRGIGLASGIAPYTRVFCDAGGYEAFAAGFELEGVRRDGSEWRMKLSPETYALLGGSYNRRNVHGAALAFAPRLPDQLRDAVLLPSLEPGSALRRELGVPDDVSSLRVHIVPRAGAPDGPWTFPTSDHRP